MLPSSGAGLCLLDKQTRSMSRFKLYLSMWLIASSASKSYHSKGAELGDGKDATLVSGESNINSGEFWKSPDSTSPENDFFVNAGDTALAGVWLSSSALDDVDAGVCSDPLALCAVPDSPIGAYKQSLSDFVHVAHRGRNSSHFTRLLRQVKLLVLVADCTEKYDTRDKSPAGSRS